NPPRASSIAWTRSRSIPPAPSGTRTGRRCPGDVEMLRRAVARGARGMTSFWRARPVLAPGLRAPPAAFWPVSTDPRLCAKDLRAAVTDGSTVRRTLAAAAAGVQVKPRALGPGLPDVSPRPRDRFCALTRLSLPNRALVWRVTDVSAGDRALVSSLTPSSAA